MAKFRDGTGRIVMRSTKQEKRSNALDVARTWELAAQKARRGELTAAAATKVLNEMLERTGEQISAQTTKEFFTEWLDRRTTYGRAASTVKRYTPVLDGFINFLGPLRSAATIASVTPLEIERFRSSEVDAGKTNTTADFSLKVLKAVFGDAYKKGIIPKNPAIGVEKLTTIAEERQPFSPLQIQALLSSADTEWRGMILLGAHCGLRIHDAASLTFGSVNLDAEILRFTPSKTARHKRELEIPLHRELVAYFSDLPKRKPDQPLFPSLFRKRTGSGSGLSAAFGRLVIKARIAAPLGDVKKGKGRQMKKLGFHSLRHTFISAMVNSNVDSAVRMRLAGHTSEEAHKRYLHLDFDLQKRAITALPTYTLQVA